jgi:hypothetical protein
MRIAELERDRFKIRNKQPGAANSKAGSARTTNPRQLSPAKKFAMSLDVKRPVIDVTVRRYVIELSDEHLTQGRLARSDF